MTAASGADRFGNWTCPGCGKWTFQVIHSCPRPDERVPTNDEAWESQQRFADHVAASGADQPTLRDQLAERTWGILIAAGLNNAEAVAAAHAIARIHLPVIEADRERAVANALAARVLRDIDYAIERDSST